MSRSQERRATRRGSVGRAGLTVVALVVAALLLPLSPAQPAGAKGGAAAATVGNGLTTTDLNAVGMNAPALASALVGAGVTVSNVTFSGANAQAGAIHVVDPAVVSFNDGIILSSGNIADVIGPNKSDGITGDMAGPADTDLNALIADTQTVNPVTYDAASLEFDFVPTTSQVYFTYTFASDEYLEWVNLFNDVFAFFVNGQNCATVPTGEPVTIDTINSAVNPALFRDNSFSSPPANPINIESDGLSVEMICSAPVNAGQTNHMKLAIADTSDQILDSVVMIKAGSLSTTKPESCNDGTDNDDDTLVDMADDSCSTTTTPPPVGVTGIGSSNNAPPFTGNEGTPIGLDASALEWVPTPDSLTTSWTVTGINGTTGTCQVDPAGRLPLEPDGSAAVATAVCTDQGEYRARIDGWDIEGKSAWDSDVDFFVHNAPPAVTIDAPLPGVDATPGVPVDVSASVTDPGVNDAVTCEISWGDGTTEAGSLAGGTCTGSHAYGATGSQVLSVTATDDAGDSSAAATVVSVASILPVVHPGAGSVIEGNSGQATLQVPLTLSAPALDPVTVDYSTLDIGAAGVATAGVDYVPTSGTVTFDPGETTATVSVSVLGDTTDEPPLFYGEWILVPFTNPSGATIDPSFFGLGIGIIGDDDPTPTIKPGGGGVVEGTSGDVTVQVPVTLSNPSAETVTVDYTTLDTGAAGTATAGVDFVATSGTVTFAPGETTKTVSVTVHGDAVKEAPLLWGEWILVAFSHPSATATLDTSFWGLGIGVVIDDD